MIRIASLADTHADTSSRWDEHCRVMEWIAEDMKARGVDLVLHGGDVFDGRSNPTEREFVAEWIRSVADFAQLGIVAGNHDFALEVAFMQRLRTHHPVIAVERSCVHQMAGVAVAMLPWPRKAHLLASLGQPAGKAESERVAVKALQDILTGLGTELQTHVGPKVLLSHSMITGSKTDSRQPIVGADMEVSLADLALARASIVLAGHVHAEQSFEFGGVPIIFDGAPYHIDYGEPGPCSYVIAEFDGEQLLGWSRVPVPARPMLLLKAVWDGHALVGPHRLLDVTGAEVRVQFSVPADQRDVASLRAAEDKAAMLERGAALVKMDEQVEPTTRARVPEITTVRTLEDKLDVLWAAKGTTPEPDRRAGIFAHLAILEDEIPVTASAGGAIRLDWIRGHGIWRFKDFEINLRDLPGLMIAVTGPNGAGKTTLLECIEQLLSREGATRGTLKDNVSGSDGWLEGRVVNGAPYTIRQTADGIHGGGNASVVGPNGPIEEAAGITPYLTWAKKHLPSKDVLHSSQFIFQGSGGFLALGEAARKAVLLRALGIERLEKLSELARKLARETETMLTTLGDRIADEQKRGMDVGKAQAELDAAFEDDGNAGAGLLMAKDALARVVKEHDRLIRLQQDAEETRARRAGIQTRLQAAEHKLQELTARAESARALTGQAETIRAAVQRLEAIGQQVSGAEATKARVQAEHDAAKREQEQHEQAAKNASERSRAAAKRAKDHREQLDASLKASQKSLGEESEKLANNKMLLEHADEINEAVEKNRLLAEESTKVTAEESQAQRDLERALLDGDEHRRSQSNATTRKANADKRVESAKQRLQDRDKIQQAAASLPQLEQAVTIVEDGLAEAEAEHERVRGLTVAGAEERIAGLRGTLIDISGHLHGGYEEAQDLASRALSQDDDAVRMASLVPLQLKSASEAVARAKAATQEARKRLEGAKALAGRAGEMEQAQAELAAAEADRVAAEAEIKTEQDAIDKAQKQAIQFTADRKRAQERLAEIAKERSQEPLKTNAGRATKLANAQARVETLEPVVENLRQTVTNIEAAIAALPEVDPEVQAADLAASEAASKASAACDRLALARTELDRLAVALMDGAMERERLQPVASKLDALVQAEALASDLQAQVTTAGAEKAAIEAELATVPDPGQIVLPDTSAQEAAVQAAEKVAQETVAAIAVAETKLQAAKDRERKLEEFAQERRRLEDEISDWTRLGQDLGRGGLQAIEIDAAGPSLTEMINTLLRAVAGSRWTVSVETARWNKDGDKQIEGCEIQVVDTKENWTGPADRLSGGEKVMVGEAVSLAISLLACQRAGMEGITLVRDEAGAALDPQNAPLYVKMMRRAAEIVKADKVLFVSHSPDAVAEADSRIVIEDYSIRTAA